MFTVTVGIGVFNNLLKKICRSLRTHAAYDTTRLSIMEKFFDKYGMANRNISTLDAGVPVLSMHAPFEVVAKLDCYMTYRCMKAVFEKG